MRKPVNYLAAAALFFLAGYSVDTSSNSGEMILFDEV